MLKFLDIFSLLLLQPVIPTNKQYKFKLLFKIFVVLLTVSWDISDARYYFEMISTNCLTQENHLTSLGLLSLYKIRLE